ncbi:MAG: cytochrome P450 [Sphingomicrobium sp.]
MWRLLWKLRTSNISIWPERAFDELLLPRRVFGQDTLLVNDPAGIKDVLATHAAHYQRYMVTPRLLRPVAGDGVLLAEGDDWRQQRRSVSPAFTPANVEQILPQFGEAAEALCARIAASPDDGINLYRLFQTAAIDALGRGLFSLPFDQRAERLAAMARTYFAGPGRPNAADSFARHEGQFRWVTWRRRRFQKAWFAEIDSILSEWRETSSKRAPATGHARDIMSVMSRWRDPESGRPMSDRELRHQTATMIAAGFETTALTMFWTAFLLANNPATQEDIRTEIAISPPAKLQSMKDLERWPRLRETIFEAMRLYPPVAFMSRICIAPTRICDRTIAPGTIIVISPWVLHRHRSFWTEPDLFRPSRFADQPRAHLAGGAFIPFGAGPRNCLGASFAFAETMILLAHLVHRFRIDVEDTLGLIPRAIISTTPSVEPAFHLTPIDP